MHCSQAIRENSVPALPGKPFFRFASRFAIIALFFLSVSAPSTAQAGCGVEHLVIIHSDDIIFSGQLSGTNYEGLILARKMDAMLGHLQPGQAPCDSPSCRAARDSNHQQPIVPSPRTNTSTTYLSPAKQAGFLLHIPSQRLVMELSVNVCEGFLQAIEHPPKS